MTLRSFLSGVAFWLGLVLLAAFSAAVGFGDNLALANGRATLISTQEQGPYRFEVSILPSRAVVNNTHLSLRMVDMGTEEPLTTADVRVSAVAPHLNTDFGPLVADNDVLPQFFETTLPFDAPGLWEVSINVNTELGEETIAVSMDVREGRPVNLILVAAIAVAVIALGIWTYDRIRGRIRTRRARG